MESNWTRADFKAHGRLQGASGERLGSTHEALARELALSLSAFLRCSVAATYSGGEETLFGDLHKGEERSSCYGAALARPGDCRLLVELDYAVLFPLVGVALGAKAGSFPAPGRKPTDIESQVVNILFRLILSEAYRSWSSLTKQHLETVSLEVENSPSRAFQLTDSVFVARFDLTAGEHTGRLSLVVPPDLFANGLTEDEAPSRERTDGNASIESTLQLMLPAKVSVDVWLEGAQMRLQDLLQLRQGQVVKLDHPVERRATCTVNGMAGFSGQIVSTGARRAFLVEETSPAQSS